MNSIVGLTLQDALRLVRRAGPLDKWILLNALAIDAMNHGQPHAELLGRATDVAPKK